MATVYTLLASQVPLPIAPSTFPAITSMTPTVADVVTIGDSGAGSLSTPFNQNAVRIDALGRAGAGGYAIDYDSGGVGVPGFELTVDAGLVLDVAPGQAVLDSAVQKVASQYTCQDNIARAYLWLSQTGVISQVNNSIAPVAGVTCFLGSVVTSAGAILEIDGSGVCYFKGPHLWRRTADLTTPTDSPPAGLSLFTECPAGIYLWTGTEHVPVGGDATGLLPTSIGVGETFLIPAGRQAVMAVLDVAGDLSVLGTLVLIGE